MVDVVVNELENPIDTRSVSISFPEGEIVSVSFGKAVVRAFSMTSAAPYERPKYTLHSDVDAKLGRILPPLGQHKNSKPGSKTPLTPVS